MDKRQDREIRRGKNYCLRLLSLRPRSEREIETRLKSAGYDGRTQRLVVDLLKKNGLVNDLEFAEEWVNSRLRSNPRSRKMLRTELRGKGVPEDIIERVFSKRTAALDDKVLASELVRKRMQSVGPSSDVKLKAKLFRFLVRRGFDPELAEDVVTEAVGH